MGKWYRDPYVIMAAALVLCVAGIIVTVVMFVHDPSGNCTVIPVIVGKTPAIVPICNG